MAKDKEEKELKEVDEYEELTLEDRVVNIEKKVNWTFGLTVIITIISVLLLIFVLADGTDKSNSSSSNNNSNEATEVSEDYDVSEFKEIKAWLENWEELSWFEYLLYFADSVLVLSLSLKRIWEFENL